MAVPTDDPQEGLVPGSSTLKIDSCGLEDKEAFDCLLGHPDQNRYPLDVGNVYKLY